MNGFQFEPNAFEPDSVSMCLLCTTVYGDIDCKCFSSQTKQYFPFSRPLFRGNSDVDQLGKIFE